MRLLSRLLDILFPPRDTEALVRSATDETLARLVAPTEHTIDGYPCTTLLPYTDPLVRALVVEAKFRGNTHAHTLLGNVLQTFLSHYSPAVLVPIPLSEKRRRSRGINQVEEIMRRAASSQPTHTVLVRIRETAPQTELSGKARQGNLAGAFSASSVDSALTYLIIDDVTTTGATLSDAARALSAAGAVHIRLLALARA